MIGDDLRLKHYQTLNGSEWVEEGRIIKVPDSRIFRLHRVFTCVLRIHHLLHLDHSSEFTMEMYRMNDRMIPSDERINFVVEYVWNAGSFDRWVLCNTFAAVILIHLLRLGCSML
jgi:hypothetical protein